MNTADTIAAIATPPGRGGIGVLRISGTGVRDLTVALFGSIPTPRHATLQIFRDAEGLPLDRGLALFFAGPASFTGEDLLEFQAHGGPVLMDMLLARVLQLGARQALPGEFTQRAFLNDKLDLAQAEAIADLIDSGSTQAARAAMRSLRGEFSRRARQLSDSIVEARMHVEAAIDFPEEEIDFLADQALRRRLEQLTGAVTETLKEAQQGALLQEGMTVVIAGRPNAGKSSLLNALAGHEAAIVTPIPGTTRDVLRERITVDGMPLHVIDTAGLRDTQDPIESEGIRRARIEIGKADRLLYVIDSTEPTRDRELERDLAELDSEIDVTLIYNKIDLARPPELSTRRDKVLLSARTGAGVEELRQHLKACMGWRESSATTFSARRRHLDALIRVQRHVDVALQLLSEKRAGELMAEELRLAQNDIGEITGELTSDDLLGKIFSSFCIGK